MAKKILVVEDEKAIADILIFNLQREGYETLEANDGSEGLRMTLQDDPDLVLLDVMLPGMDGFTVCQQARKTSQVPIIMLTAREEETDKVTGLELGADDYITKPFSMRELMARVKANIRRTVISVDAPRADDSGDRLVINTEQGAVYKKGVLLDLSVREYDILTFLSSAPGKIFSREQLMEEVWGYDYYGDLRAVDVAIRRLREKIEDEPAQPKFIVTKRGFGYFFADKDLLVTKGKD